MSFPFMSFHFVQPTNQPTQTNQINHQPATNKQQTISRTNIHRWATVETRRSVAAVEASSTPRAPSATGADGKFMAFVKFVNQTKRRNPKRFTKNGGKEKPGGVFGCMNLYTYYRYEMRINRGCLKMKGSSWEKNSWFTNKSNHFRNYFWG